MFNNIGPTELIIVLVIVLLIFGPKRLPGLGRQLGAGMREFKDSITGRDSDDERDSDADEVIEREPATSGDGGRHQAAAALGRPDGEPEPLKDTSPSGRAPR